MCDDRFTGLFKYVEKRFGAVDRHFEKAQEEHADLKGAIVELAGQIRDYPQ